jgi:hypothetical protein
VTSLDRGAGRLLAGADDPVPPRRWRAFSLLAAGYFMTAVDLTIVNVALPLAGVTERDAGVASGLIDTSQQLGGAIGIAVASTVAAGRSRLLLGHGSAAAGALTGGFHAALWVSGLVALAAVPVAFLLIRPAVLARAATR